MAPDAWLRGPVPGIAPVLMPAAHAFVQAGEDIERAAAGLSIEEVWLAPGGAASVGFHLRHIAGATDRLLTYARGEPLSEAQRGALAAEREPGDPAAGAAVLLAEARAALEGALAYLRAIPVPTLSEPRTIGSAALPTNVIGIIGHAAEHAVRHAGQAITTAKIVRGLGLGRSGGP